MEDSFLTATYIFLGTGTIGDGEDLNYIWSNGNNSNGIVSISDKGTQHRILKLWTNFVKHL